MSAEQQARRQHYLQAMGITVWTPRDAPRTEAPMPPPESLMESTPEREPPARAPQAPSPVPMPGAIMVEPARQESRVALAVPDAVAGLDWEALRQRVHGCTSCPELVANRTQTVFGVGNPTADWMVIGEAPGADEDRQGEPFVGRAGQLLNAMLQAAGFPRDQVYIANILKCRPPNNRDPGPEEAARCEGFLHRQIALVRPKLILVVGRIAAQRLLDTQVPVGRLRGRLHRYGEAQIPLVVTYHPAYLLRSPQEKRKAWDDLRLALTAYREAASP